MRKSQKSFVLSVARIFSSQNLKSYRGALFAQTVHYLRLIVISFAISLVSACGNRGGGDSGSNSATPPGQSSAIVTVSGISPTVLAKENAQLVSSVDSKAITQAVPTAKINSLSRDLIGLMIKDRIFGYALQDGAGNAEISPTTTAVYMVLQVRELTQLPTDKLALAVADIKAHPAFADFVAYIKFSIESGMPDPLNPQTNFLLLKRMRPIAESINPAKYAMFGSIQLIALNTVGTVLNAVIGSANAETANEFSCTGAAAELCGAEIGANTLSVNNFRATPYMAYPDSAPNSMWDSGVAFGRESALEKVPLGFSWNSSESISINLSNLRRKIEDNALTFDRGSANSILQLPGIGSGNHKVHFSTMGVCRFLGNSVSSLGDSNIQPPIETMSNAQWAAMFMNVFSLALITADSVAGVEDVKSTRNRALANLKGDIAPYTAELKGMYAAVKDTKKWVEDHKVAIRSLKFSIKFLNELSSELKTNEKLDATTRDAWENLSNFASILQQTVDVFDSISDVGELNDAEKTTFTSTLAAALQDAGLKWADKTLVSQGGKIFLIAAAIETPENIFGSVTTLTQLIGEMFWEQSGVREMSELVEVFRGTEFNASRSIGALSVLSNNKVVGAFFEKAFTGAVKVEIGKRFGKQAIKHFNAVSKAVSTGWAIGTKMLPAWLDSCSAPEALELDIVNGQVSAYGSQKIQIKIEDLTAASILMDYNEIDGTPGTLPTSIEMVDGHNYRYTVRGFQDGVLDRSRNGTDAAHRLLDGNVSTLLAGRSPQAIWSIQGFRVGELPEQTSNIMNEFLCVKKLIGYFPFVFADVKVTDPKGLRYGLECVNSAAYSGATLNDPVFGNYAQSRLIEERIFPSWVWNADGIDWAAIVRDNADRGFGNPFHVSRNAIHNSAEKTKALRFAFDGFGYLDKQRNISIAVNTLVYRVESIDCGVPIIGQVMSCVVKGEGFPLASTPNFALTSTVCASVTDGALTADPSVERRFNCIPNVAGSQSVTLTWSKLSSPVVQAVTVAAPNLLPVAAFLASPGSAAVNAIVAFDASATVDPDGTIVSYAWDFGDGTFGSGKTTTHAYSSAQTYVIVLTVTDNKGASSAITHAINVSITPANNPPLAAFAPSTSTTAINTPITFDASSSVDSDGTISTYSWDFGDGTAKGTGKIVSHTYTAASGSAYIVKLTVTDNVGATATASKPITITATPKPDLVPSAVTLSASTVEPGATVTVNWKITNSGNANAAASTTELRLLNATDTTIGSSVNKLASVATGALAIGASATQDQIVTIPAGTAPGSYKIVVIADFTDVSGQINAANDIASSSAFTVEPATPPGSAPIAHYRLDGSLANAIVGSPAGDLTVVGSPPTFEVGQIDQGANLTPPGATAGSYLSGSPLVNADTAFTIAAWVKPNSIFGVNALVYQRTSGGGEAPGCPGNAYNFGISIYEGKWLFQVSTLGGGGCVHGGVFGPSPTVGKFYHVAGVYDKVASKAFFYIDGILVGEQAVGPNFRLTPNMVTTIGNQPWASPLQPANSTIDDLRVYYSAFSQAQISTLISSSSTSVLFDTFDGAAIDLTKWTVGPTCCGFSGTASVGGSELTLGATANIDTRGKFTISGDNTITIEARMVGPGANRDTTIALVDAVSGAAIGSAAQSIEFGDTSYSAWGFHMNGYGAYNFLEVERPSGVGPAPQNSTVLGGSTNVYMEYRLTITGNQVKMERGPTLANITQSVTRTLGQSIAGKSFYIRLSTGGGYSPAVYDWVRVSTIPSN